MESMDIVRLEYWNENTGQFPVNPWKMSMEYFSISMEFFKCVHGTFPWNPWSFPTESMDFFHSPWRLSRESVDKIHGQCPKSSMGNVHGKVPWTMSTEFVQVHCGQDPWTMSMEYFHGHCPLIYSRWLCSVNPEKTFESYCFHAHYGKMHLWLTLTVSLVDSCY